MGVLSKALRLTILVAACSGAGCSVNQSTDNMNQASGDTPQLSTDGAGSPETAASDVASTLSTDSAPGLSGEQILGAANGGPAINVERGDGYSRYLVDLAQTEPVFDVTMVKNPNRLVVDLLGEPGRKNQEIAIAEDPFLKSVRLGAHKDKTRIVFDVKQSISASEMEHEVDAVNGKLIVTFHSPTVTLAQINEKAAATPAETKSIEVAPIEVAKSVEPTLADSSVQDAPVEVAVNTPIEPISEPVAAVEELAPVKPTLEPEQVFAEDSSAKPELVAAQPATQPEIAKNEIPAASVEGVKFEKSNNDAGHVLVSMSEQSAFELRKTAPSEYALTIAGAKTSAGATAPQIAPKGFPGIRSVRASQQGDATVVRMFVDQGVDLQANVVDNNILVKAERGMIAKNPEARAQLEAGDQPQGKAATPAAPEAAASSSAPDENTARANPTGGIRSSDGSKQYSGRLISLDLQDTDIDNALRIIAEVSNLNIIASDDVTGKVTLRLIDVPWDQALDVILKTNGLDQVTEGNVIRIAPIDKLRQEREALQAAKKAAELLEELTVDYIRVSYARATELKEQVESVLTERGTVSVDERTNQLIIRDTKQGHKQATELLKKLDLRTPQVLLETQIVESGRNILRDLGFQWNFSYSQSPKTGNATGLNFPNSVVVGGSTPAGNAVSFPAVISDEAGSAISAILDSADGSRSLSARLTALEDERKVKVVSRPQVATVNNKQAEISSVETFRVRTPSAGTAISTGAGASASGSTSTAFEEIKVGIELKVTPQASPDYFVLLDVKAKSSTLGPSAPVDNIPSTLDREATSTILVKSGQTFALGGVYRLDDADQIQGVPFLKDIPFMGHFFRRSNIDKQDEELIFFITPHIVEGSFDPSLM